jgi:integrase
MERRKGVGREAQRKSLGLLVLALNKAIAWGELQTNPAAAVSKPKHRPKPVTPPTPRQVEEIRELLMALDAWGTRYLVSVLAYAGLRPQEALALCGVMSATERSSSAPNTKPEADR